MTGEQLSSMKKTTQVDERAQWAKVPAAKADDLSLLPENPWWERTHPRTCLCAPPVHT